MRFKLSVVFLFGTLLSACTSNQYEFKDYKQLLARGEISAITNPDYVTADNAVLNKNSYVLGVVVKGQARAYSLNILNNHEVVNDTIGDFAYAAVW